MIANQDPLNPLPDQASTLRMFEQMDFIASIDLQMSCTTWYSDVVFPESTHLEPVVQPKFDAKPCFEIVQGLTKKLNLGEHFDYIINHRNEEAVRELRLDNGMACKLHPAIRKFGGTLNKPRVPLRRNRANETRRPVVRPQDIPDPRQQHGGNDQSAAYPIHARTALCVPEFLDSQRAVFGVRLFHR
jgi:anaerobic selenocysteine-containing dehydrogenase